MNAECKILKKDIRMYLHGVNHRVSVFLHRGIKMIDVVYEDFYSEKRVHDDILKIAGTNSIVNVKRECSEEMIKCCCMAMGFAM